MVRKRLSLIKSIFLNGTEGGVFDATIDSEVLFKHEQIKVSSKIPLFNLFVLRRKSTMNSVHSFVKNQQQMNSAWNLVQLLL